MTINVGGVERAIRMVLGTVLVALGLTHVLTGGVAIVAYVAGAIALLTGLAGSCPVWTLLGINTCPIKQAGNK